MNPYDFDPYEDMADRQRETKTRQASQAQGEGMICLSCGSECQTAHHWDGAKSYKEWICGDCKVKELTDRLAKAEKERDKAIAERDELKRGKSCDGCEYEWRPDLPGRCPIFCERQKYPDYFKPRDPSAEQEVKNG